MNKRLIIAFLALMLFALATCASGEIIVSSATPLETGDEFDAFDYIITLKEIRCSNEETRFELFDDHSHARVAVVLDVLNMTLDPVDLNEVISGKLTYKGEWEFPALLYNARSIDALVNEEVTLVYKVPNTAYLSPSFTREAAFVITVGDELYSISPDLSGLAVVDRAKRNEHLDNIAKLNMDLSPEAATAKELRALDQLNSLDFEYEYDASDYLVSLVGAGQSRALIKYGLNDEYTHDFYSISVEILNMANKSLDHVGRISANLVYRDKWSFPAQIFDERVVDRLLTNGITLVFRLPNMVFSDGGKTDWAISMDIDGREFLIPLDGIVPSLVTVHYQDSDGRNIAAPTEIFLHKGEYEVFPEPLNLPEGYTLLSETPVKVVVGDIGADSTAVTFVYEAPWESMRKAYGGTEILEYGGHHYSIFPINNLSWQDAVDLCEKYYGHMATFSNADEDSTIYNYAISLKLYNTFFGLFDLDNKKINWVTDEPVVYTNWWKGSNAQPNLKDQRYGQYYAEFNGFWADSKWKQYGEHFICEWDY